MAGEDAGILTYGGPSDRRRSSSGCPASAILGGLMRNVVCTVSNATLPRFGNDSLFCVRRRTSPRDGQNTLVVMQLGDPREQRVISGLLRRSAYVSDYSLEPCDPPRLRLGIVCAQRYFVSVQGH